MGEWKPQSDTQKRNSNIPATSGTYKSDPYYIGLSKNDEPITITISDFTITKPEWIKDVSLGEKSSNGNYYPLTYKVEENSNTSEREGIISIMHKDANKSIEYQITQAANTTQGPTEPTLNEYVFQITKYNRNNNYSLQVCGKSPDDLNPDNKVSFASISTNDINDSTLLSIDIKIALKATNDTSKPLNFNFMIIGDGFEFDSSIDNPDSTGNKSVNIMFGGEEKGKLQVDSIVSGLYVHITISSNNQNPKSSALLSEDTISTGVLSENITGKITIKNSTHKIQFNVTLGFGALQQ